MTLAVAKSDLKKQADPQKALSAQTFLKNCQGSQFLGVTVPLKRKIAKNHWQLPLSDVHTLMKSRVHDERSLANEILVLKFKKADEEGQKEIYDFYIKHKNLIYEWDSVDGSAPYIVGAYLMHRDKSILYELIDSDRIWDRRIAIVSTWPMIRKGYIKDTLKLVKRVLDDEEDLIHKAAGWMLREVGKQDEAALIDFLKKNYSKLPRTTLRYAIERFPKAQRDRYLKGSF